MTALSRLLNEAKSDRSVDDLIVAAEKRLGHTIRSTFRSTIYKALEGDHARRPREETLRLFADVFDLDIRMVRMAANRPAGELGPWAPVAEAAQLSQPVRDALDQLIKAIVREGERGQVDADEGPQAGPFDEDLDALEPEADAPIPIRGRSTKRAARKEDEE